MRDFCKTIPITLQERKRLSDEYDKLPKYEFFYNCQLDCMIYRNGVLIGKQKQDGTYIEFKK